MSSPNTANNIWARLKTAAKGVPIGNAYALLSDDGTFPFSAFPRFYLDPVNGDDANDGLGPTTAVKTLAAAWALCSGGANETIVLIGNGAASGTLRVDASFNWNKNATHLIGICSPVFFSQRARIAPTGATTAFTPFFAISGNGCIFQNIQWYHGFDTGDANQICLNVTGERNYFGNCHIGGMADTASATSAGSRSLKIGSAGSGENVFEDCVIGVDTVTRAAANASLELAGGTPRNVFRNCLFPIMTSDADALAIIGTGASCIDRENYFIDCIFANAIGSTSTALTVLAALSDAAPGGLLIFKRCMSIGATKFGDTNALANSYIDMAAVSAAAGGLGVNPS